MGFVHNKPEFMIGLHLIVSTHVVLPFRQCQLATFSDRWYRY